MTTVLTATVAVAVASVFAASAAAHLRQPERTERIVARLGLPTWTASLNAGIVVMLAVGLVATPAFFGAVAAAYLCCVTFVMLAASRSREIPDCGCFASSHRVGLSFALRNVVLTAAAGFVAMTGSTMNWMGPIGIALAGSAGVLGAVTVLPRPTKVIREPPSSPRIQHESLAVPTELTSTAPSRRSRRAQEGSAALRVLGSLFAIVFLVLVGCNRASEEPTTQPRDVNPSVPATSPASTDSSVAETTLSYEVDWVSIEPNRVRMGDTIVVHGRLQAPFPSETLGLHVWLVKDKTFRLYDEICRTTPRSDGEFRCEYKVTEGGDYHAIGPGDYLISVGEVWATLSDAAFTITD